MLPKSVLMIHSRHHHRLHDMALLRPLRLATRPRDVLREVTTGELAPAWFLALTTHLHLSMPVCVVLSVVMVSFPESSEVRRAT